MKNRLTQAQEQELWGQYLAGDTKAKEALILSATQMGNSLARNYQGRGIDLEDLEQVACLAVCEALPKFNPDKGTRFTTYAYRRVQGALLDELQRHGTAIRLPKAVYEKTNRLKKVATEIELRTATKPSTYQLADAMGMTPAEVLELKAVDYSYVLLSAPVTGQDETMTFAEIVSTYEDFAEVLATEAEDYLCCLSEDERRCFVLRYGIHDGEKRSVREVARLTGLSPYSVRLCTSRATTRVSHPAFLRRAELDGTNG